MVWFDFFFLIWHILHFLLTYILSLDTAFKNLSKRANKNVIRVGHKYHSFSESKSQRLGTEEIN